MPRKGKKAKKLCQISLSDNGLESMVIKKFNRLELAQKIHASRDQCHVHLHQFWWAWLLQFQRYGYLSKMAKFPFRGRTILWSWKNIIDQNRLKKFMQVGIDVKCMYTNFGGCDPSSFGDMATFQKQPNFPFGAWTIVHGHRKF